MSLEVDRRDDGPIPQESEKSSFSDQSEKQTHIPTTSTDGYAWGTPTHQQHPKKSSVLHLGIALAIMTVLAVVAAAAAGSMAVKWKHELNRQVIYLNNLKHDCSAELTAAPASSFPSTSTGSASAATDTPSVADFSKLAPVSNCTAIGDTYTSAGFETKFKTYCGTDYLWAELLGVWMFKFADCMEGCASWNWHRNEPTCYAVSYDHSNVAFTEQGGVGNCFFKGAQNLTVQANATTDSAVFQLDSVQPGG